MTKKQLDVSVYMVGLMLRVKLDVDGDKVTINRIRNGIIDPDYGMGDYGMDVDLEPELLGYLMDSPTFRKELKLGAMRSWEQLLKLYKRMGKEI